MIQHGFPCPKCGSADVRRSHRQGFSELPKMLIGIYPFRCLKCGNRFFGNVWVLATRGRASCPRCLRLDVTPQMRRDSHLTNGSKLMLALGARLYRCTPCRYTFVSFRKASDAAEKIPPAPPSLDPEPTGGLLSHQQNRK